uniref:Uncharacterized protein n=1 Tax=viral metagenome TaxID=1070528 RepID=A0A6M3K5D0_9ZZZZ
MIKVYKAEAEIAKFIFDNTSIAYQHELVPLSCDISKKEKIKAGLANWLDNVLELPAKGGERDSDLHYVQSVLVTTNWNKNDDVFDIQEVWNARHTPQHKPTNVGHDEHEIVGHMTANWVIGEDGGLIDDDIAIEDLPSLFHVINGSVIYKAWQDTKLFERAQRLIEEIDAGRKFVSMECMFTGFDYAILTPDNQSKVLARNEETSFLTKHLRAYGGSGLYDGYKVGRLLRNITFTGKGFVDKPANPNSIIFDKNKFFDFAGANHETVFAVNSVKVDEFNNSGVYNNIDNDFQSEEEILMTDFLKDQNVELKAKVDDLVKQLADADEKLAKIDIEKVEKLAAKLEDELKDAKIQIEELTANCETESIAKEELVQELVTVKESRDILQKDLDNVKANELRTNRISTLVDGGIDKEVAEKKVDLYNTLSDEQFSDLANELIEVVKIKKDKKDEKEDCTSDVNTDEVVESQEDIADEEIDDAEAETEVLDNVEQTDDVDLSTAESDSSNNDIRSKLSRAIARMLGKDDNDNSEEN